jgi:hypothetical protein
MPSNTAQHAVAGISLLLLLRVLLTIPSESNMRSTTTATDNISTAIAAATATHASDGTVSKTGSRNDTALHEMY